MLKSILLVVLFIFFSCMVSAQEDCHPCDYEDSGNWCYGDGYVSCPNRGVRPCQAGLVCQQTYAQNGDMLGVIYCVRPSEYQEAPGASNPTTAPKPTSAPTQKATASPTSAPTSRPTNAPSNPTTAPTSRPPTTAPTSRPTSAPTTRPTTAPTTKPPGGTSSPSNWPNGPLKAIYIDNHCWDPSFSFNNLVDAGYNLIILAFFLNKAPFDCVIAWQWLSEEQKIATSNYAHSKGARIIVSAGGATDNPYLSSTGTAYGQAVANYAVQNHLDGVDFDLENFGRDFTFGSMATTQTVQWVVDASNAARAILGSSGIIAHAPQPPYFGNYGWADGYGKVYDLAPHIDFFLVQYYNNGPTTTYETIFLSNGQGASVTEIAAQGIPMSKIVVGKPVHSNDIDNVAQGYNTAEQLRDMFSRAKSELGWNAGVMGWQWTDSASNSQWIRTIYP